MIKNATGFESTTDVTSIGYVVAEFCQHL